ncbi:alcohol dehydrogenase catalytic domain-containing protein [Kutzneria kofuensis]|uniref:Alcohol dehydrogenase n=1 Tax=Kutzneria kofuensis TaxID=103725 RepID=A0A7W9KQP4_9PSEU|nr:zinc-binding alcohol dehydrogenase family protein [Kutzneria kofuensis]MBB5896239.1 alcohol dehydrogenase [Kutzneria kofuensis]
MKAAVLTKFGAPLTVRTVPDPVPGTGEVLVDVVAAPVLPYTGEVIDGDRGYMLNLPVTVGAGAVGRVRSVGPDATRLRVGDWVLCDPTIRSRDDALTPDIMLQGWSARGDGGLRLQDHFGNGSFAEQLLVPTENAIPLGSIDPADAGRWAAAAIVCLVPYGGLLAAELAAGETVLVNGATGNFGSAGVAVALAMGAACVVAPGRDEKMLAELENRFGSRVRTVRHGDTEEMRRAAPGPIDVVLDLLPPSAGNEPVRAAAMTVREYGRVVLMGGVQDDVSLPYRWLMRNGITVRGQWMCPRWANFRFVELVRSGLLDLDQFTVTEFALDDITAAVKHAATSGRFAATVIAP